MNLFYYYKCEQITSLYEYFYLFWEEGESKELDDWFRRLLSFSSFETKT